MRKFSGDVIKLLVDKKGLTHFPHVACFNGYCQVCQQKGYNWSMLRVLLARFWESGPDVNEDWKQAVRRTGIRFDADALHELCLSAFIGGGSEEHHEDLSLGGFTEAWPP